MGDHAMLKWATAGAAARSFAGRSGGAEHYISVEAPAQLGIREQIEAVRQRYEAALTAIGVAPETAVFRRIFLSDAINQAALVRESGLLGAPDGSPVAVSIIQQPPLPCAKIALLAYHVESPGAMTKTRVSHRHMLVEKSGTRHLWSTRVCVGASDPQSEEVEQTREIFEDLIATLGRYGATLRENCVRTWFYLRDVDVFYPGMVKSRRDLFIRHGLTTETHYIASTGIEGSCAHQFDRVAMDAYSILDLQPRQMSFLNDFDRLCPTKDYYVTFERGTRIAYADRCHHFISGTASIDNRGEIVHVGDVMKQLDRTLENIEALLRSGGAGLADMSHMIVYLRDRTDFPPIEAELRRRFPDLPMIIVQGPVCRPEWLIEIEGVAIAANEEPTLPSF